ncbi:MAG: hypothetical protein WBD02_07980 [Acidimicrobiia bacterium]
MPGTIDANQKALWRSWLVERSGDPYGHAGFDATGWEATTWVLHYIFENPKSKTKLTHDEVQREAIKRGLVEPMIIGDVDLLEGATLVGYSADARAPGAGWVRLRWHDLARRSSISFDDQPVPPCFRWFPYRSWPANLLTPVEGSLDRECLRALTRQLASFAPDATATRCVAHYSPLANGYDFDDVWMEEVLLGEVEQLVDTVGQSTITPSNLWPIDGAWMLYTDSDLWATKVSGPQELINMLRSNPELECIDWPSDPASASNAAASPAKHFRLWRRQRKK